MKVGVLSIQGLPARHGAFEQTIDQIVRYAQVNRPDIHFFVGCNLNSMTEAYSQPNVTRAFFKRTPKLGVIGYGLKAFFYMYGQGVRSFLIMGYGLAPFFWLFEFLGCSLVVNVDGFEWRRAKWSLLAKRYFKLCELLSVNSKARLIYDSIGVARYYGVVHRRLGYTLFYGTELINSGSLKDNAPELVDMPYFVVVMRMEPENHILQIVRAFLASCSQFRLVLIGPSTEFFNSSVKPLISNELNVRVVWLGPIYCREKLHSIRSEAIAYVHGHSVGGTNPTLVEACWINRPVIAYRSIFNREVLGAKGTYFKDEASLTKIFNEDVSSLPLPPKLNLSYSWEYVCNGYLQLLR